MAIPGKLIDFGATANLAGWAALLDLRSQKITLPTESIPGAGR